MPDTNKCWLKEPLLLAIRIFCFLSVALHISLKNIAGDNSPTLTLGMLNTWDSSLASYRVGSEISSAAAGLVSRTLGGRTQYKQLPEPNMPVSTLISQAMGSRCFFSLGLALILPSAPAAFPESPSDELPWKPLLPLPICASSSLVWDFLFSQQEGPSQHEALSSAWFWGWGSISEWLRLWWLESDKLPFDFWLQRDLGQFIQCLPYSSVKWR